MSLNLRYSYRLVAAIQTIPWIVSLLFQLPGASKSVYQLRDFAYGVVQKRRAEGSQTKDVYYYLVRELQPLDEAPADMTSR